MNSSLLLNGVALAPALETGIDLILALITAVKVHKMLFFCLQLIVVDIPMSDI